MADFSGGPGFLAFLATFGVVIAVVFLAIALNKQLRRVRTRPPGDEVDQPAPPTQAVTAPQSEPSAPTPA